jgi:SAM-dependent methyltransferase
MEAELYEEHALLERDQWWFVARRRIIERVLTAHLPGPAPRRILDVGCGTGGMLPMLARFGVVSGLEGEPLAVAHCRSTFGQFDVQRGEIPHDVPADGSYDVVTAFDVIEHIDDDTGAVRALRSALRPGGTVVVTVPALRWLWSDHDVVNGHRRRYTRAGLVDVIERAGLTTVHTSYFNTVLLPAVAAARLVQRLRKSAVELHSDFAMPSAPVNRLLTRLMATERGVVASRGLPIGVSLIVVATRPLGAMPNP